MLCCGMKHNPRFKDMKASDDKGVMNASGDNDRKRNDQQYLPENQQSTENFLERNENSDGKISNGEVLVNYPDNSDQVQEEQQSFVGNHHSTENVLERNENSDGKISNAEVLTNYPNNSDPFQEEQQSMKGNPDKNGEDICVKSNFKDRLQKNYDIILNCLTSTDDIAGKLFEKGDITQFQLEDIQQEAHTIRKIQLLMNIIQLGNEQVFDSFLSTLLGTGQPYLSRLLEEGIDFNLDHVKLIQDNYTYLIENMDSMPLLDTLYGSDCFTPREYEAIMKNEISFKRNEELLRLLMRKDSEKFALFVEALHDSKQGYLTIRLNSNSNVEMENTSAAPNESQSLPCNDIEGAENGETLTNDVSEEYCDEIENDILDEEQIALENEKNNPDCESDKPGNQPYRINHICRGTSRNPKYGSEYNFILYRNVIGWAVSRRE